MSRGQGRVRREAEARFPRRGEGASMRLDGVSAVVTGGSSGLGAATAARLIGAGAKVVITDLGPPAGGHSVAGTEFRAADIRVEEEVRAAMEAASSQIVRAHVCTPVTNAHLVCRLLLEKKNQ